MKHDLKDNVKFELQALLEGRLHNPFSFLGPHLVEDKWCVRTFQPGAAQVQIHVDGQWHALRREDPHGLFVWEAGIAPQSPYRLRSQRGITIEEFYDPYCFESTISGHDLYLFASGKLQQAYRTLGARHIMAQGVSGIRFCVWAPNAERVSVVGNFNNWDGRIHPMRTLGDSGCWELFLPELKQGELYKFEIRNRQSGLVFLKSDPYAQEFEVRPGTAARTTDEAAHHWQDAFWLAKRAEFDWLHQPINIYELHAGSWKKRADGRYASYRELAQELIPHVRDMGYTHIEFMPLTEHPLDESWGYQTTGYFAATHRYGTADDLRFLIDACHQENIGVILDWVPAHFPNDSFALAHFDGTALYEHEDPRVGFHQDWGTHIFNYGRNEVRSFLFSSAHFWLSEFHIDGLRVDAVASMLYLDYSRRPGEWLPNKYGGRENLEAIDFLRELNVMVHLEFPGALTFAEESTAWPMVSRPTYLGGLGFSMKWNMGWMNDTLKYMEHDPIHRRYHHSNLSFGQLYAYTENFVLPFSHDEVVHGKRSMLDKMPGDPWQKFANLRLVYFYQMTYPGKKLNFMGNEFAQGLEWQATASLQWGLLDSHWHKGVQLLCKDLSMLYRSVPALHEQDFTPEGFSWIDCHDADQSMLSYARYARDNSLAVAVLNFTPVPRHNYRIGVPQAGVYRELCNTDSAFYGGSNLTTGALLETEALPWMGYAHSLLLTAPPLAGLLLVKA